MIKASNQNYRVTNNDQDMGIKLQPKIRGSNKLRRKIHSKTHIVLVIVRVGLKQTRRLEGPRNLQIIIQMMILIQKDQILEKMLMDLVQIMIPTSRQQLRNLTEVLEKSLLQWLNRKR